jgi:hypothetical protein
VSNTNTSDINYSQIGSITKPKPKTKSRERMLIKLNMLEEAERMRIASVFCPLGGFKGNCNLSHLM